MIDALLSTCDADDGLKDGMISIRKAEIRSGNARVQRRQGGRLSFIAASCCNQESVRRPEGFEGKPGLSGILLRHRYFGSAGHSSGVLRSPSPPGPPIQLLEMDIDREARAADTDPQGILTDTGTWTNLNTFSGHGGKIIFFHGVSDPWFSAQDTIGYYNRVGKDNGGLEQVRGWSRLFLSPGMAHCGGGEAALDSFDLLSAVVDWVEKGTAPDGVRRQDSPCRGAAARSARTHSIRTTRAREIRRTHQTSNAGINRQATRKGRCRAVRR